MRLCQRGNEGETKAKWLARGSGFRARNLLWWQSRRRRWRCRRSRKWPRFRGRLAARRQEGQRAQSQAAANRFSARADVALGTAPASKGEWGLLIADAETGETLYELNADKYFVPASNMKLFTTALALAKLGPEFRFHTTLETHGTISPEGTLAGDVFLVGRGDPNLSNRKFPYELKEEFDGAPERVLAELADALVAKGLKEITGDIVGDDSYFPREIYPDGWEIGDTVWNYGAAISAIVVDDNTVTLTLTPGELPGSPVQAALTPATPDFYVQNDVVTSAAEVKSELTLTREPGAKLVVVRGTLPAQSTPRKLVLALHEPAEHAAALLTRLLDDRGVKIGGTSRAVHIPETAADSPRAVLAEHVSIPLGDSVKLVNKISQNVHTEMLLRTAARQNGIWATPEDLAKFPLDFYAAAGIAAGDVVQEDASGLSRHDLVTPRAIVALLKYCAGAAVVCAVLCVAAGGGRRWDNGRSHEEYDRGGEDSRKDRLGGACADAIRVCRDARGQEVDFFISGEQSGREKSRSDGCARCIVHRDARGIRSEAREG